MSAAWFRRSLEVVCHGDVHQGEVAHVAWLFPDAPASTNADALLIDDAPAATLKDALLAQATGSPARPRFRIVCPVCGERGTVVEARATTLIPMARRAVDAGASRVDIYSLQRYISD